jgi:hypothetical protein
LLVRVSQFKAWRRAGLAFDFKIAKNIPALYE